MPRIKRGVMVRKRHKKIKKLTKGYMKTRQASIKKAKEAVVKAGQHAYRDRRGKKRLMRRLWISQLNAYLKANEISYSKFMGLLKKNKIELNRKILAELAQNESGILKKIIEEVKS
ncbi:MAG TPA: 50S ribosomal protein L20 [Patescibacteria group bacterium]|nr:50S ribosomal protein L20 [Patescibacteria group bacterium]